MKFLEQRLLAEKQMLKNPDEKIQLEKIPFEKYYKLMRRYCKRKNEAYRHYEFERSTRLNRLKKRAKKAEELARELTARPASVKLINYANLDAFIKQKRLNKAFYKYTIRQLVFYKLIKERLKQNNEIKKKHLNRISQFKQIKSLISKKLKKAKKSRNKRKKLKAQREYIKKQIKFSIDIIRTLKRSNKYLKKKISKIEKAIFGDETMITVGDKEIPVFKAYISEAYTLFCEKRESKMLEKATSCYFHEPIRLSTKKKGKTINLKSKGGHLYKVNVKLSSNINEFPVDILNIEKKHKQKRIKASVEMSPNLNKYIERHQRLKRLIVQSFVMDTFLLPRNSFLT